LQISCIGYKPGSTICQKENINAEKKNIEKKRLKTIIRKHTIYRYSPELDLYSQGLNTFHKFPLPSEISSSPAQENNDIKKSLEKTMFTDDH